MNPSPEVVLKDLQDRKFQPVYFLQGDEPFYIDKIAGFIEQHALPEAEKAFNQVICYGKDVTVGNVLNQARRFPMMAERTVVIVREAQEMADLTREDAQNLLEKYIAQPLPTTVLVFCHKHKTLDGRKPLAKTLAKFATLVESKKLYDNKLPDWIINYGKENRLVIQPDAAQLLADFIGNDLSRLASEIDKLLLNLKDKKIISAETVQQFVGISKEYNPFELQKALLQQDVLKANRILNYFAANPRQHPIIPLIALLFSFFTKVLLVHKADDKSEPSLAKLLAVNPFFVKDYLTAARKYNFNKTVRIIHALKLADLQSKGIDSNLSEGDILKELVFNILH